jgi:hypothetical protein
LLEKGVFAAMTCRPSLLSRVALRLASNWVPVSVNLAFPEVGVPVDEPVRYFLDGDRFFAASSRAAR